MSEKIIGYILLLLGLVLIFAFSLNVFLVFTKQASPVSYFKLPSLTLNTAAFIPDQLKNQIQTPPNMELLSGQALSDMANLTLHLVLMSFLVGVAFKIASLGIQLIRPISIKLPSANLKPPAS
jgi:hypothetical protein